MKARSDVGQFIGRFSGYNIGDGKNCKTSLSLNGEGRSFKDLKAIHCIL